MKRPFGAEIFVLAGPSAGRRFAISDRLAIGAHPDNQIVGDHLAPFQAAVELRGGEYFLESVGGNGALLEGRRVKGREKIREGAQFKVGDLALQLMMPTMIEAEDTQPALRAAPRSESNWLWPSPELAQPSATPLAVVPGRSSLLLEPLEAKDRASLLEAGQRLQALLKTNALISTELDVEKLFEKLLAAILDVIPAHRGIILTAEPGSSELVARATQTRGRESSGEAPGASTTIARRALKERVGILTLDAGNDARFGPGKSIVEMKIRSAICAPMLYQDEALGVIYLDTLGVSRRFGEPDLQLLTAIAAPAGAAIRNALLVSKLKETAIDTIFRLSVAAEYRDDDTGYHIHRMSDYAEAIARSLGSGGGYCELIKLASPMHDVGKIGIPDAVLKKPGRLNAEELAIMRQHPAKGGAILANAHSELLRTAEQIALTHHEKFDGTGYPRGLRGKAIPLEGRIVALADVFDALLSRRCYKPPFPLETALEHVATHRGTHFDPDIVEAFFAAKGPILEIRDRYIEIEAKERRAAEEGEGEETVLEPRTLI
ncbi:MAG: HD domain-containing protein [Deltaproteobacteria bacterium]|nr:HD domain-containing protein [Deltaproteobacteria bacterium]